MSEYDPLTFSLAGLALRQYPGEYPVDGIDPYRHQWGMFDALSNGVSGAFVNAAPTGGGKTLSWLAPAVTEGLDTIAVYPTNALIEDQRRNIIEELLPAIEGSDDVTVLDVTGETIGADGKYAETFPDASSNGQRLSRLLGKHLGRRATGSTILLTNPDTFVLMRRGLYHSRMADVKRFELAVVDEFHRANRKEQNTMLFLLDEMYDLDASVCELDQLVFLSATPDKRLERKFDDALTAPYYRATEFGWCAEFPSAVDTDAAPFTAFSPGNLPDGHKSVLPPVRLTLYPAQTFGTAAELLDDEGFIERVQKGRTVIMLDGIHEVDQVYEQLVNVGVPAVARIDGFNRQNLAEKLDTFETLVSNSAVEVGVDFDTDQIMFSGHDVASFFQRLGRLRTRTDESLAEGYVPPYTFASLDDYHADVSEKWVSRRDFEEQLKDIYVDDTQAPESFDHRYSAVEAYDHIEERIKQSPEDKHDDIRRTGWQRISRHFFPERTLEQADIARLHEVRESDLLDTLKTYRGESIQTIVYNTRDKTVQSYNIPYLLRHGDVSFHPRDEFLARIPTDLKDEVKRLEQYSGGYCIYRGQHATAGADDEGGYSGRQVCYKATGGIYSMLSQQPRSVREPMVATGLEVEVDPSVQGLDYLKDALSEREVLCYALEGTARQIQNMYSLGPFGFIYPLLYSGGSGDAAVAFGHDALYLHCRVQDEIEAQAGAELDEVLDW